MPHALKHLTASLIALNTSFDSKVIGSNTKLLFSSSSSASLLKRALNAMKLAVSKIIFVTPKVKEQDDGLPTEEDKNCLMNEL